MRKAMLLALGVGLCLGWGPGAQAGQDDSRALIDKAIKAHGATRLAKVKAIQFKGKGKINVEGMEIAFTADISEQFPDKQKLVVDAEINNMNFTFTQVFNGKKGWKGITGMIKPLDKEEVKEAREQIHVEEVATLLPLKGKGYKLSPLGEAKVGDHDTVGVQVSRKGFRDVNLYFDKKTHLLRKAEYRAFDESSKKEVTQEKLLSGYKDTDGFKAPSKMLVNNDGKKFMEIEITEMTLLETPLEASVFAKPD
jgi:hypothetical protein